MFRPIKIRRYVSFMQSRGFAVDAVLAGSGIEYDKLTDPTYLIDLKQSRTVVANMIRLTGNQGIGFEVGRESELIDHGIIAYAMLSSRTLRGAVDLWVRYSNILVDMLVQMAVTEDAEGNWTLGITELMPLGFIYNFCVEEQLGYATKGPVSKQRPTLRQIDLSYPAPAHQELYHQLFECPIHFNAHRTGITYKAPLLDLPLRGSDDEFHQICVRHCDQIMRQMAIDSPIVARLRSLLLRNPGAIPDLDEAAHALGLSARTLRRQLRNEGFSYQKLVNEFRADLANEYLESALMTPKEVGYHLGFSSINAFRRAFKSWTGKTIQEYRHR